METDRVKRRLAAILALDVVGFSRLMAADEKGTLADLIDIRKTIVEPLVEIHIGRIVKLMGDGALAEFSSVIDALECAINIQNGVEDYNREMGEGRQIQLRVGVNLGDVIVEQGDIYGDGVNLAARLEALAEPGEICISGTVFEHVRGKVDAHFQDIGRQHVKNISEPIQVYRVVNKKWPAASEAQILAPDMPSIAVMALDDMSGDREQAFFCDAISEEVTTALARFDWLFVAARNSAFQYKGEPVDIKRVGRELGVRYILEGSIQRMAGRSRVNVQLIETNKQGHIWADRIDSGDGDPFEVQDDIVARIASTVAPELLLAETSRANAKSNDDLNYWDYYLLARAGYYEMTRASVERSITHLDAAIELNTEFADAHALYGLCLAQAAGHGWKRPAKEIYLKAHMMTERALRMAPNSPEANHALAWVLMVTNRAREAVTVAQRSIELNPHYAEAYAVLGHSLIMCGELVDGLEACHKAQRSNPRDPRGSWLLDAIGHGYFFLGEYEQAIAVSSKGLHQDPSLYGAIVTLACANARLGRTDEAKKYADRLVADIPRFSVSAVKKNPMFVDPELVDFLLESLRLAGLPE